MVKFGTINGATVSKFWNPNVTHVIVATNDVGACTRTFKFLMAILTGKWIVKVDCTCYLFLFYLCNCFIRFPFVCLLCETLIFGLQILYFIALPVPLLFTPTEVGLYTAIERTKMNTLIYDTTKTWALQG